MAFCQCVSTSLLGVVPSGTVTILILGLSVESGLCRQTAIVLEHEFMGVAVEPCARLDHVDVKPWHAIPAHTALHRGIGRRQAPR